MTSPSGSGPAFQGVGSSSIPGIKKAAKASGLVPPLIDTNDYDAPSLGGGGFHATGNAVDWSNGGDNGTPQMDQFAAWVASNYGPVSLEIIHVNQDGSTVEWKYGQKMPTGWYGKDTLAQHRNHVHWAITNPGLKMAGNPNAAPSNGGSIQAQDASLVTSAQPAGLFSSVLGDFIKPVLNYFIDGGMVIGGTFLMLFGIVLLARSSTGFDPSKATLGVAALAA